MTMKLRRNGTVALCSLTLVGLFVMIVCFFGGYHAQGTSKASNSKRSAEDENAVDSADGGGPWSSEDRRNLKHMFIKIDATADGKISKKEITWFINRRVTHHMQT
jgi:hypothetical protein